MRSTRWNLPECDQPRTTSCLFLDSSPSLSLLFTCRRTMIIRLHVSDTLALP